MKCLLCRGWPLLLLLAGSLSAGCERTHGGNPSPGGLPTPPPPEVLVSRPVIRKVTDYEDFPGRTDAVNTITIKSRVTGYLDKVLFKDGADVHKDDVLFEIDPRPYQAEVTRAEGAVLQSEGRLKRLEADYQRARILLAKNAMGREDFDKIVGDHTETRGALKSAQGSLEMAKLNLGYTKVRAPISGRISRRWIDPGNLVKADDTAMTSIVSLDPIYALFDVDERTTLRLQRLIRERKVKWSVEEGLPIQMGLADEEGFTSTGLINFADNVVDADTGTWRLRAIFANPKLTLTPGLFVRLRAPIGAPYEAMLVSEQALSTDQGQKFLYVIDDANQVAYKRIKVGRVYSGLRVITEGLKPDEQVIVNGTQRVRQGVTVVPKLVDMPDK
jgi:RND family efflux transporter MFP subunit